MYFLYSRWAAATLDKLSAFLAVCRLGSFSAAAEHLRITQPTLSHRMKALESHYRCRLVTRRSPIEPTSAGAVLLEYAQRVVELAEDAERAMTDHRDGSLSGHLRVAASASWGLYLLPPALMRLQQREPDLAVELVMIANSQDLARAVLTGHADVGVGLLLPETKDTRLRTHELLHDEWYLVMSARGNDLPAGNEVAPSFLNTRRLIIREPGSATRVLLERLIAKEKIDPPAILEFSSTEAVKKAVEHDLGISLIAGATIASEVESGMLRAYRVVGHRHVFPYFAATQRGRYSSNAVRVFLDSVAKLDYARPLG
jgi:LysR family transcriptional regulator, transcriptional activator of the cysJI operon